MSTFIKAFFGSLLGKLAAVAIVAIAAAYGFGPDEWVHALIPAGSPALLLAVRVLFLLLACLILSLAAAAFVSDWLGRRRGGILEEAYVPVNLAVNHVAEELADRDAKQCFERTRQALRQAALDGRLRTRGKPQLKTTSSTAGMKFSAVHVDVPKEYWQVSVINALATAEDHKEADHTMPESVWSWGPEGVYAQNHYSELMVNARDLKALWPWKGASLIPRRTWAPS